MPTTQQFLEVDQVREGLLILKNKGLRGVLMVSSLNFALKSEEEQAAILAQFQAFLNTLDFSCQILVQSRRLNITGYLEKLKEFESTQKQELLKIQAQEYRRFVEGLVSEGIIMTKRFLVIVPFFMNEILGVEQKGLILQLSPGAGLTEEMFQRCKVQLWQRMEFVILGLRRCGLQVVALQDQELIELLWSLHHPKEAEVGFYPEIPPEMITQA